MVLEFSEMKDWYLEGKYKPYYDENPDALYDVMRHFLETVCYPMLFYLLLSCSVA